MQIVGFVSYIGYNILHHLQRRVILRRECFVRLIRPLVAGSRRYILTFPALADILFAGANSGKLEERGFKIDLYLHNLTHLATQDTMGKLLGKSTV